MSHLIRNKIFNGGRFNISIVKYNTKKGRYCMYKQNFLEDVSREVADWCLDNTEMAHWFGDGERLIDGVIQFRYRVFDINFMDRCVINRYKEV